MKKLTTQEFIEKAKQVHGDKYDYSKVDYINSRTKVCIICSEHGEFWQLGNSHLQGQGCPKCTGRNKSRLDIIQIFNKVHGNKYDYSEIPNSVKSHEKIPIICPNHGKFLQSVYCHSIGQGCPKCKNERNAKNQTYTWQQLKTIFDKKHNNKYDYSQGEYIDMDTPIQIICPIHGPFYQKPKNHIRYAGCQKCKSSKGELKIEEILNNIPNISFEKQFKLTEGSLLYIDFKVCYDNRIYFIEYNGIQHYIPVKYFGGELKFQKQQTRDEYLRTYCREHNIELIEIPYNMKEKDIQITLNKYFTNVS